MRKPSASPAFGIRLDLKLYAFFLKAFGSGKSKSAPLKQALEILHKVMLENEVAEDVETYEQAFDICLKHGIDFDDNPHDRSLVTNALKWESMTMTERDMESIGTDKSMKVGKEDLREIARSLKI